MKKITWVFFVLISITLFAITTFVSYGPKYIGGSFYESNNFRGFIESKIQEIGPVLVNRVDVDKEVEKISSGRKYIRGLFSGGTLCDEAQIILGKDIENIFSNRSGDEKFALEDSWLSKEHTLVDLGEDEFTVGRLHPMMDFDLRNKRILQEAKDDETAIILFDLVLGYGANIDPIGEILPVIKEAQIIAPDISFICSVTGTELDPQNKNKVIEILEKNDILVMPSNAAAAEIVNLIIKKINK